MVVKNYTDLYLGQPQCKNRLMVYIGNFFSSKHAWNIGHWTIRNQQSINKSFFRLLLLCKLGDRDIIKTLKVLQIIRTCFFKLPTPTNKQNSLSFSKIKTFFHCPSETNVSMKINIISPKPPTFPKVYMDCYTPD